MRLADGVSSHHGARQMKDLLLDIGCEKQQVHDLGDAGAAHVRQGSQLRIVLDNASAQKPVKMMCQGQQPRHSRHVPLLWRQIRCHALPQLLVPVPPVIEVDLELDSDGCVGRCALDTPPHDTAS